MTAHPSRAIEPARHLRELAVLGLPVFMSSLGNYALGLTATILVGRHGAQELAHLSVALSIFNTLYSIGLGLLLGTRIVTAIAFGAERLPECGAIWQRSMSYALAMGFTGASLAFAGPALLRVAGQNSEMAGRGGELLAVLLAGLPAGFVFIACAYFLEGLKRPLAAMGLVLAGNLLYLALGWLLVYGAGQVPAAGAMGAAWAMTATRTILAVGIFCCVWRLRDRDALGLRQRHRFRWRDWRPQRRLGLLAGMGNLIEMGTYTALVLLAAKTDPLHAAAFTILITLESIPTKLSAGIGAATAVRVSIAYARARRDELFASARTGWLANLVAIAVAALVFCLAPDLLVGIYTADLQLAALATPLLWLAALVMIADGSQIVALGIVRALGDGRTPLAIEAGAYLVLMMPLAWLLAVDRGLGVRGLVLAMLAAYCLTAALALVHAVRLASSARLDVRLLMPSG